MAVKLDQFVRELVELHGDNLCSIVLYGRAAAEKRAGNAAARHETAVERLLVVLKQIAPSDLKRVRPVISKWYADGNPIPSYFTIEEINDAADVFPIEFLDMSRQRKVLAGKDPFKDLHIPTYNLRHQVEYELRSKLIRLRALYLPASATPDRLARLMFDSLESFQVIFRHVIHLLDGEPPNDRHEALNTLCNMLRLDHSVFAQVERFGSEGAPLLDVETEQVFTSYLAQIERVIEAVDSLDQSKARPAH